MSGFWHLTPVEQKPFDRITRKLLSERVRPRPPPLRTEPISRSLVCYRRSWVGPSA